MEQGTSNQPQKNSIVLCFVSDSVVLSSDSTDNCRMARETSSRVMKAIPISSRSIDSSTVMRQINTAGIIQASVRTSRQRHSTIPVQSSE